MNTDITYYKLKNRLSDCSTPYHIREVYKLNKQKTITERYRNLFLERIDELSRINTDADLKEAYNDLSEDIVDNVEIIRKQEKKETRVKRNILDEIEIYPSEHIEIRIHKNLDNYENLAELVQNELVRLVADSCESTKEMARILGISNRSVRNRLYKAMDACKTD
jgi:DNA-directed RNA polymerase specialized sigma24 family protein